MAFTYSGNPADSDRDAVRFYSGDTDANDPLLQNTEVEFAIAENTNLFLAAAECCEAIAAKFARKVTRSNIGQSANLSDKQNHYEQRAMKLRQRARRNLQVFAGGLTKSGKRALDADTDATQPDFARGMDDFEGTRDPTDRFREP